MKLSFLIPAAYICAGAVLAQSEEYNPLEARELVDELNLRDVYEELDARDTIMSVLSTRDLVEELSRRATPPVPAKSSGGGSSTKNKVKKVVDSSGREWWRCMVCDATYSVKAKAEKCEHAK